MLTQNRNFQYINGNFTGGSHMHVMGLSKIINLSCNVLARRAYVNAADAKGLVLNC